ncbi:PREDICTED: pollen receptor-like kinase 3 [Ipomoea nil]|uniref:pollen receptor-like kinase 3 n=1 Tax=Ipomoea nil TaxID=35883 RepID=UPI00090131AD|nr:PREDICTED: pollen receptor-like kinase 3 [Ipomoea nil]
MGNNDVSPFFFFSAVVLVVILRCPSPCAAAGETEALLRLKESLENTRALEATWKSGTNPCEKPKRWFGIQCRKKVVSGLLLHGLGLGGVINVEALAGVKGLRVIAVGKNNFSGPIPEFNKLGALRSIFIQGNKFSGEISADYFLELTSLKKVWLANNKFKGRIPGSLEKLPHLIELHLEGNEFSGQIPTLDQKNLADLNVANNKLQGEVPAEMKKFGPKTFAGNPGLCGKAVGKECPHPASSDHKNNSSMKWIIIAVAIALLIIIILIKRRRKDDNFARVKKENLDEVVPVHKVGSSKRSNSGGSVSRRGPGSGSGSGSGRKESQSHHSRRGSGGVTRAMGDLVVVNSEKGQFGLPDLMKAAAEVLGSGGLGSAYKAVMGNGVSVVVKRLKEINTKITKDNFDAEIKKLGKIKHPNILTPLAYHYRKEEKLVISEYMPKGSLLYLLHGDRGISHAEFNWPKRLKVVKGVANGMGFLHKEFATFEVPHGNLKSSNILFSANNEAVLTDYAYHPLLNNTPTAQQLFAYKAPEGIQHQQVSPKSDVYCLGVIILEIITGKFPSQYVNNQNGGTDVVQWVRQAIADKRESEVIDPEIAVAKNSLPQMEKLVHIGGACTENDLINRIDMKEAIKRIQEVQE